MRLMKIILPLTFLSMIFVSLFSASLSAQTFVEGKIFYFRFNVNKNNTVTWINYEVASGVPTSSTKVQNDYTFKLVGGNKIISEDYLPVIFTLSISTIEGIPVDVPRDTSEQTLRLQYTPDADSFEVYHKSQKIFQFDIPKEETPERQIPWLYIGIVAALAVALIVYLIRKNYTLKL